MAASRASSVRILRAVLTDTKPIVPTKRGLHITGTRNSPAFSPTGAKESLASFNRRSLTDLKEECRRRTISSSGTKHELVERLINHDALQSRAFSIAMKQIIKEQRGPFGASSPVERAPSRHFNTSRSLKAVNDNSTIDFAYLPIVNQETDVLPTGQIPILPDAFDNSSQETQQVIEENMKPEIYTVSDPDGTHASETKVSSLQDVVDNHSLDIDPYNLTETVTRAAKQLGDKVENQVEGTKSGLRLLWEGFVDDLLGEKKKTAT